MLGPISEIHSVQALKVVIDFASVSAVQQTDGRQLRAAGTMSPRAQFLIQSLHLCCDGIPGVPTENIALAGLPHASSERLIRYQRADGLAEPLRITLDNESTARGTDDFGRSHFRRDNDRSPPSHRF